MEPSEGSALAINVTIPDGLQRTDVRRGTEFRLMTLNVRLLPDGWRRRGPGLTGPRLGAVSRIFTTSFASVYPHYVAKVERKGRTSDELDQVIGWLTGFDESQLRHHLDEGTTFEAFFADARLNPNASLITGVVCGVRVEDVEDTLMQQIRYLDKLVDELARGRPLEKVLRE